MRSTYKPSLQRATADTQAITQGLEQEQSYPSIPQEDFDALEQYAGLSTPIIKGAKKVVKTTGDFIYKLAEPVTTTETREASGKGIKSPKQLEKEKRLGESLEVLDSTATKPTDVTPEVLEAHAKGINEARFISRDEGGRPLYEPRMDAKANYRLDAISDDDDLDSAVQYMAEEFKDTINQSRRDVLGDNEANQLANELGLDKDALRELLTRPDGSTASVEEVFAMRKLMTESAGRLKTLAEQVRGVNAKPEDNIAFEQAFLFHKDVMSKYMGYRAEAGRGLRAYGVNMGQFADATAQQEMLDLAMSGYDTKKIANIVANSDDTRGINETVKTMGNMRKAVELGMTNFINSILSGVSTQVVNLTSGVMQLNFSYMDRLIAEGGTRARMFLGRDTTDLVQAGEAGALRVGMFNSWRLALKTAGKAFKTGNAYGGVGKFQSYSNPITSEYWGVNPNSFMGNMIDGYGAGTSFMVRNVMGGTDAFFKIMAEQGQYTSLAYRKAYSDVMMLKDISNADRVMELEKRTMDYLQNPTVDMIRDATLHAQKMTYQDTSETAQVVSNMVKVQPWLKAFIPFINTPTSIFKQNLINRTPLAVFRPALYDNTAEGQIARSQLLSGMMLMWGASEMVDQGWVTGSEPLSIEGIKRWETEGRKAHSFAIPRADGGVTYVSYNRMENIAYPIGIITDLKQMMAQKELDWDYEDTEVGEKLQETVELIAIASMRSMEDKTFVSGLDSLIDVVSGGRTMDASEDKLETAIKRFIVPAIIPLTGMQKDINAWFLDDNRKDTKELMDKVADNLLYLNKNAVDRLDYYGRELKNEQRGNPFAVTYSENDVFFREADRLYKSTMKDVIGGLPRRVAGVKLTSQEYHDMVKYVRNEVRVDGVNNFEKFVKSIIKKQAYKDIPRDEMKVVILKNAISKWDNNLMLAYIMKTPALFDKWDKAQDIKNKRKGRVE